MCRCGEELLCKVRGCQTFRGFAKKKKKIRIFLLITKITVIPQNNLKQLVIRLGDNFTSSHEINVCQDPCIGRFLPVLTQSWNK